MLTNCELFLNLRRQSYIMTAIYNLLLFMAMGITTTLAATTMVDLTGPGCDQLDGYYIKNADDLISLYAMPQYNTIATRDHCDVTVRADTGRRIEYIIENIFFNECGVEIIMYDNPTIDTNPIHTISCSDNSKVPIQGKTNYNVFRLRVRKTTPESRAFEFAMRMKNDIGPSFEFEKDAARYLNEILEPGAIVGIAIAGGVVVIAVIALAIYLCIRARNSNLKHQSYHSDGKSSGKIGHSTSGNDYQKQYLPSVIYSSQKENMGQWRTSDVRHEQDSIDHYRTSDIRHKREDIDRYRTSEKRHDRNNVDLQRSPEIRPPRKLRPPVPMPTQPAPRDPDRKGLSDRHRSGEHAYRPSSHSRHTGRSRETFA